jgi:hypothetical protein
MALGTNSTRLPIDLEDLKTPLLNLRNGVFISTPDNLLTCRPRNKLENNMPVWQL